MIFWIWIRIDDIFSIIESGYLFHRAAKLLFGFWIDDKFINNLEVFVRLQVTIVNVLYYAEFIIDITIIDIYKYLFSCAAEFEQQPWGVRLRSTTHRRFLHRKQKGYPGKVRVGTKKNPTHLNLGLYRISG